MIEIPLPGPFNAAQLHAEARGDTPEDQWPAWIQEQEDGSWSYVVDSDVADEAAVQAAVEAHVPDDDLVADARTTREARAASEADPTANLIDTITTRLADEKAKDTPDDDLVLILSAIQRLGLYGLASMAVEGRVEYAERYLARVS